MRRIVHYYPGAMGNSGVTFALWSWARAQAAAGAEVCVLHARDAYPTSDVPFVSKKCGPGLSAHSVPHRGRHRLTLRPVGLGHYLDANDLLVLHEGWVPTNLIAAAIARRMRIPYIVMPHGVYDRRWMTYLRGPRSVREYFEREMLEGAAAVHLFFPSEIDDVKALAPRAITITVPTGMDVPGDRWLGGGGYYAWLGRIDPVHKGLDTLVGAIAQLPPAERPLVRLRGYDYRGGVARLETLIHRYGVAEWVRLEGPVAGAEKVQFLQQADGYVLPSRWECHSIALLETLALGVPAVVSKTTHIAPTLERSSAAVLTAPCEPDLAEALTHLPSERPQLAERGRALVATAFNWGTLMPRFNAACEALGLA